MARLEIVGVSRTHFSPRRRRRLARTVLSAVLLVAVLVVVAIHLGQQGRVRANTAHSSSHSGHHVVAAESAPVPTLPSSVEAGIEPWSLPTPVSREAVVAQGEDLEVLGGLLASNSSTAEITTIDLASGKISPAGVLAAPVHDGAGATLGSDTFVFGGGSPDTLATVQDVTLPPTRGAGSNVSGAVGGALPQPRSDLSVATVTSRSGPNTTTTAYLAGGYNGTSYLPDVLSTADGTHFSTVANLLVPVRYSAMSALGGRIYLFGGQIANPGGTVAATDDIQMIDPIRHTDSIIGHLPQPLYGAAAVVLNGTIYVAGGQTPGGQTITDIEAFDLADFKLLHAGLLPQGVAFSGYTTVGTGASAVGYLVGGEVSSQTGQDQAGVASGLLTSVISLRPSAFGGPAGTPSSGSPYVGTLLIADRGNDRLIAINSSRQLTWTYPSATMPAPPGGFYFPDDAFFFGKGTGIISNQEDNHTIVEIGYPSGKLLWQYGHPTVPGSAAGYLNQPDDAYLLRSGVITVADASNNRILFISPQHQVLKQIGNGTDAHVAGVSIAYPNGDTPLADGDVLVSEINGSWIDEYTPSGTLVWTVQMTSVNYPSDPQQLGADSYLMTDYDPPAEGRVLEFTREGRITWEYDAVAGDGQLKKPSLAERLTNGLIMVNDDYRNRVVVIDPATKEIVWQYGITDVAGTAPGLLSIPDGFDLLESDGSTPTHPQTG